MTNRYDSPRQFRSDAGVDPGKGSHGPHDVGEPSLCRAVDRPVTLSTGDHTRAIWET